MSSPNSPTESTPDLRMSSPTGSTPVPALKPPLRRPKSKPKDILEPKPLAPPIMQVQQMPPDANKGRAILGGSQSSNNPKKDLVINSKLSPFAAEFIPRQAASQPVNHDWSAGDPPDQDWMAEANEEWVVQNETHQEPKDPLFQTEKAVEALTLMPGGFNEIITPLVTVLTNQVQTPEMLEHVISKIFENSVNMSNFHYSGARMCSFLCNNLELPTQLGTFRQCLMKKCQHEHMQRDNLIGNRASEARVIGFTLFMAELFLQLKVNDKPIIILAGGVRQLLITILSKPTDSNIKSAVQVLKLTGAALEDTERDKDPHESPELDKIFQRLQEEALKENASKSVKTQLLNVIELRASNWGRIETTSHPSPTGTPVGTKLTPFEQMEPVFYNSKGQVISREEAGFAPDDDANYSWQTPESGGFVLDQWDDSGEMTDEMTAAYEEFCRQ